MESGPKHHLKRLDAPSHWMLDKVGIFVFNFYEIIIIVSEIFISGEKLFQLGGVFASRPAQGPHKLRESLPLILSLRNRLKYALT